MNKDNRDYFVHETAVVEEGCSIGTNSKIWHFTHLMAGCKIGKDCIIGQNVFVASQVELGNHVKVQNNVSLYAGVVCEDDVFVGPSAVFTNVINPRSAIERKDQFQKTMIRRGATVGANATIVCGNEIGQYALVGAGSVVTKPVPDYALVVGNPAQQIGWVSACGHRLEFDAQGFATCPESGQKYQLEDNTVREIC